MNGDGSDPGRWRRWPAFWACWARRLVAAAPARWGGSGGRRAAPSERLERLPLGPQHTLHLVRLGETVLLVASSPGGCALVESIPATAPAAAGRPGR